MSKTEYAVGTPTPLLLEARKWSWKHVSGPHTINVPFENEVMLDEKTGMNISTVHFDYADDVDVWVDFGSIIKVMFNKSLYPSLSTNQVFSISSVLLDKSRGLVTVVGNIIEKMNVSPPADTSK